MISLVIAVAEHWHQHAVHHVHTRDDGIG